MDQPGTASAWDLMRNCRPLNAIQMDSTKSKSPLGLARKVMDHQLSTFELLILSPASTGVHTDVTWKITKERGCIGKTLQRAHPPDQTGMEGNKRWACKATAVRNLHSRSPCGSRFRFSPQMQRKASPKAIWGSPEVDCWETVAHGRASSCTLRDINRRLQGAKRSAATILTICQLSLKSSRSVLVTGVS